MPQGARTIRLESLTRVEGEGGLRLEVRDGRLEDVKLEIYEPPRFFEAFLRGRSLQEVPDMVARICGICPYAHRTHVGRGHRIGVGNHTGPGNKIAAAVVLLCRVD